MLSFLHHEFILISAAYLLWQRMKHTRSKKTNFIIVINEIKTFPSADFVSYLFSCVRFRQPRNRDSRMTNNKIIIVSFSLKLCYLASLKIYVVLLPEFNVIAVGWATVILGNVNSRKCLSQQNKNSRIFQMKRCFWRSRCNWTQAYCLASRIPFKMAYKVNWKLFRVRILMLVFSTIPLNWAFVEALEENFEFECVRSSLYMMPRVTTECCLRKIF